MDVTMHLAALETHGRALADAAEQAGPETAVPTCPGWDVRALLTHLASVHRWAATHVREGASAFNGSTDIPDLPAPVHGVVDWYRDEHTALVQSLRAAPDDLVAMTFLADAGPPRAFWARRQAHETAIHRADVEAALGGVPAVDREFALDGIAELLEGFFARRGGRLVADPAVSLRIAPDDADVCWRVEIRPDGRTIERDATEAVDATVAGPSADLYLALWNRGHGEAVTSTGDPGVLAMWHALARVR